MKVAVSSTGKDINSKIDLHFGRCAYFVIADTETMQTEVCENQSATLSMGAGIEAARFVVSKGVNAVLTGICGPKAEQVFQAAGIQIIQGQNGTVLSAIERFKSGQSVSAPESSGVPASAGGGRGMGGGGRGMGGGGRGACRQGN
ncbi:MAG: hypothetical protein BWK80_06365 [Desulfobacteraceae bacterium IS3]|nr:MAG: hypothetical protein BWK80_06365 [Desulfobacteraceae bacterium IS3]